MRDRQRLQLAMPIEPGETKEQAASASRFVTTHWSVVLSAKEGATGVADVALERLCRTYWWPLYAFVRRRGYNPHDAEDLTQEFFTQLLEKNFLSAVSPSKGKFRSFLLAAIGNFLAKDWRRANALKRGGGFSFVSLNGESAEEQYLKVPTSQLSPEQLFHQQWALTLFDQTLTKLRDEFVTAGRTNDLNIGHRTSLQS